MSLAASPEAAAVAATAVPAGRRGRALFVLPSDRMGGAERVTRTLAREALAGGAFEAVDVVVLTRRQTGALDDLARAGARCLYGPGTRERSGALWLPLVLARRRYAFAFASHAHVNAALSLMRRTGVLRTDRLVTRESTQIADLPPSPRARLLQHLSRLYGAQDLLICQSERMARSLAAAAPALAARTIVLANPLDTARLEAGRAEPLPPAVAAIAPERAPILWCGRLAPVKAPLRAVAVLAALLEAGHDVHLVMAGEGPLRAAILAAAQEAGVAGRLTLAGHLDNPAAVMAHCRFGLLTSPMEGFPNVVVEMLACGVGAVVTTDCAGGLGMVPGVVVVRAEETDVVRALAAALGEEIARPAPPDPAALRAELAARCPAGFLAAAIAGRAQ